MAKTARYKVPAAERKLFQAALIKALARKDSGGVTALQHVANALVRKAQLGSEAAIAMIADRIDGKVGADIFGSDGPVTINQINIVAVPAENGQKKLTVLPDVIDAEVVNERKSIN